MALTHGMGCATAGNGEELQVLRRTLGGRARRPNFAAVLAEGLGCEANQIQCRVAQEGLQEGAHRVNFKIQNTASIARTVARGIEEIERLLPLANRVQVYSASRCRRGVSRWACNTAAATAIRAWAPTRRWAPPSTA